MCPVWVQHADGGQWVHPDSVADAVAHVKRNSTDIFHTQVTRAANKGAISKEWQFSFEDEIPHPPLVATPPPLPEQCTSGAVLLLPPYLFSPHMCLLWRRTTPGYPHLHELESQGSCLVHVARSLLQMCVPCVQSTTLL